MLTILLFVVVVNCPQTPVSQKAKVNDILIYYLSYLLAGRKSLVEKVNLLLFKTA